jgi:DNA-binding MarR family transcriptional regulator
MCADAHIFRIGRFCSVEEGPGIAAFAALLRAHAAVIRRMDDELEAEGGMSLAWYDVLLTLGRSEGRRMRMQELSDEVVLSRSRVSRIVDELEREGDVAREPCAADRRVVYASITREGRRALRRARTVNVRGIEEHFASVLSGDELETVRCALERVTAANCAAPATAAPISR